MSLSVSEQKQFRAESQRKIAKASSPIEKLRYTCLSRGASGINGISRQFKVMDDDSNKKLSKEEFKKGCTDFKCELSDEEINVLFQAIDLDKTGFISFDEFLIALRPPLSQNRIAIIKKVFALMDKSGDGVITSKDLKGVYNARSHPKYKNGECSEQDIFNEYLKTFECGGEVDGHNYYRILYSGELVKKAITWNKSIRCGLPVTWEEFLNYYSAVSSSIDDDVYFDLMMRNAYKI